jgi:hypothetical protein
VPAEQCPRISAEYLAAERASMGAWWFRQEFGCEFLDSQSAAFSQADIDRAFSEDYATWNLRPWTPADRPQEPSRGPRPRLQWEVEHGLPADDATVDPAENVWASFRPR